MYVVGLSTFQFGIAALRVLFLSVSSQKLLILQSLQAKEISHKYMLSTWQESAIAEG